MRRLLPTIGIIVVFLIILWGLSQPPGPTEITDNPQVYGKR